LIKVRHFSLLDGAFFTSLPWILSMISIPLGGWISDSLSAGRLGPQWGRRIVPITGMSGAGILLAMGAGTENPYFAALYLSVSTALVLCVEGPFWATVTEIAGKDKAGTGGGIMNTGCNLGGMLSPVATPWLAEIIGWEKALYVAAILSMIAAVLWFGISAPVQPKNAVIEA
jgi:MFS family permease